MKCSDYLKEYDKILQDMKEKMFANYTKEDITKYFINTMIPHHRAAIYMCENLLKFTDYDPIISIGKNIIKEQMIGIKEMQRIYETTPCYPNTSESISCYIKDYLSITNDMIYKMKNAPKCDDVTLNFVNEMIPHHNGAILMCENVLKYNINYELENVAEDIITEQTMGVKELKDVYISLCENID